jgi:uncharacterized protein
MNSTPSFTRVIGLGSALLIGIAIAAAGVTIGKGLERFRTGDRTVTVKGLAEKDVPGDYALWTLAFRRGGNEFAQVQAELATDRERVVAFLREAGFSPEEIEVRPLQIQDLFARDYSSGQLPLRFTGTGMVMVKSERAEAVESAALSVDPLIQAGVQLGADGTPGNGLPQYQLRRFNEVKAELLAEATQNAREQANKFAAEAGAQLGPLRTANQGVITISADNGQQWDDGTTRNKRLRVVSTFTYDLAGDAPTQ